MNTKREIDRLRQAMHDANDAWRAAFSTYFAEPTQANWDAVQQARQVYLDASEAFAAAQDAADPPALGDTPDCEPRPATRWHLPLDNAPLNAEAKRLL